MVWYDSQKVCSRIEKAEAEEQLLTTLLTAVFDPSAPAWLREVPAVELLRRVWVQNYQWTERCMPAVLEWKAPFRKRARALGLRRSRSIGQEKTHLQHLATAAAMNIIRAVRWLDGKPHAQTRRSALVQLLRPTE